MQVDILLGKKEDCLLKDISLKSEKVGEVLQLHNNWTVISRKEISIRQHSLWMVLFCLMLSNYVMHFV